MRIIYITIEECYLIHEKMIEIGGGRGGVRDFTLLHSALERPKASFGGKDLYPDIWTKGAALIHSLIKNHPFNDGNKRTGFFTMLRFFNVNGYDITASRKEIVDFALAVDVKNLTLEEIISWLKKHVKRI